ncbi:MAG: hypothetical protein AAF629_14170 [Chloroflexota bacterium]
MSTNDYQAAYQYRNELLEHLKKWLRITRLLDKKGPNNGGEDEANYAISFFPYWMLTQDEDAKAHFETMFTDLIQWVETDCYQGYEPVAEAHHGTEPFLFFLPRYAGLFPQVQAAQDTIIQAANFIGNWVPGAPIWYDYDHSRFVSIALGAKVVDCSPKKQIEIADQVRFIHIALSAYTLSQDEKYLDWAVDYANHWAGLINTHPGTQMPRAFYLDGTPVEAKIGDKEADNLLASHHHAENDPLSGVENLLASGVVHALGDVYRLRPEPTLKEAAKRIIETLLDSLLDPYGDPAVDAIRHYRLAFRDTSLDSEMVQQLKNIEFDERELFLTLPQYARRTELGVGRRADMLHWYVRQDDETLAKFRMPSVMALVLAFDLTGDPIYAKHAFRIAAGKLGTAIRGLRSGREHADMGSAVCSVASGHGRNWMCGAVTSSLFQLTLGGWIQNGFLHPLISLERSDVRDNLFTLVQTDIEQSTLHFFNPTQDERTSYWQGLAGLDRAQHKQTLQPAEIQVMNMAH